MRSIKTYSELITIPTFEERFEYLKLDGIVGQETFGYDRYLNQILYNAYKWRRFRRDIIVRDNGCDLAHPDYELNDLIIVHHINPVTVDDIINQDPRVFDPENVVSCADMTHKAVHYGDKSLLLLPPPVRFKNDTCPWKR